MMARPGRIFLKKAKSSWVILEKGSLSGAAARDGSGLSAPVCSVRQQTPNCHELAGRNGLRRPTGESLAVAVNEKVLWRLRLLRAILSLSVLWKIPAMTGV